MQKNHTKHKSELLLPAGSLDKLKTAILYGADAVYAGTPDLSLRTKSGFTLEELVEGVKFVHEKGKKIYLTLNLFSHNRDIPKLPKFLDTIRDVKPDGLIIADPGVFQYVKENAPELELHISTQANVCSWLTTQFWKRQGASLVVLAREVSFQELQEIREKCDDVKLEVFVHGAMCMTYSGRCLLSNFLAERGANQGNCAHSCRWNYKLKLRIKDGTYKDLEINNKNSDIFDFLMEEEFRPGELIEIEEDERGSYILNSKDLCLMPRLDEYLSLGIDSLKVEGRHKTSFYVASVARAYRMAIDAWYENPETWDHRLYMKELLAIQNRGYTLAFHDGRLTNLAHNYQSTGSLSDYQFAGHVEKWDGDDMIFCVKNKIEAGELIQFLSPHIIEPIRVRLPYFIDSQTGEKKEVVNPGTKNLIRIPGEIFASVSKGKIKNVFPELSIARKIKYLTPEQKTRVLIDLQSQRAEIMNLPVDPVRKAKLLQDLESRIEHAQAQRVKKKGPKLGSEGCCGKGCNGCMIFWNDAKYAKEREMMLQKKIGEKLK